MNVKLMPFLRQCSTVSVEEIKKLLADGADVNLPDDKGVTPLMLVVHKFDNPELVQFLINSGASVSVRDESGRTALMTAIAGNQTNNVKTLIKNGSNVNAQTVQGGWWPLMFACEKSDIDIEIVVALLDAGAMPNASNHDGMCPLQAAIIHGRADVAELLIQHQAQITPAVVNLAKFCKDFACTDVGKKITGMNLS